MQPYIIRVQKRIRELLDNAGFEYIDFEDHQLEVDLQFDKAVPMLERLIALVKNTTRSLA